MRISVDVQEGREGVTPPGHTTSEGQLITGVPPVPVRLKRSDSVGIAFRSDVSVSGLVNVGFFVPTFPATQAMALPKFHGMAALSPDTT